MPHDAEHIVGKVEVVRGEQVPKPQRRHGVGGRQVHVEAAGRQALLRAVLDHVEATPDEVTVHLAISLRPEYQTKPGVRQRGEHAGRSETHSALTRDNRSTPSKSTMQVCQANCNRDFLVKRRFHFLKDPAFVDALFVQKPERVDSLGYVLLFAFLILSLLKRRGRQCPSCSRTRPGRSGAADQAGNS